MTHTITGKRRTCPCESLALDGEAARAGAVAAYLTARAKALTDVPSLPTPPERRRPQEPDPGCRSAGVQTGRSIA